MTWKYKGQELTEIPEKAVGFVYVIVSKNTGKSYFGKKIFHFTRTKTDSTGKRKKVKSESDWKDYFGSSKALQDDVAAFGKDAFSREILHICYNKGTMSYLELREQMDHRVLERPDHFYNDAVLARIKRSHVKLT